MELKDALAAVVGPEHVDPAGDRHLQDVTENPPGHADFVVRPKTVDQVRSLMLLANERKIAITPVVGASARVSVSKDVVALTRASAAASRRRP